MLLLYATQHFVLTNSDMGTAGDCPIRTLARPGCFASMLTKSWGSLRSLTTQIMALAQLAMFCRLITV